MNTSTSVWEDHHHRSSFLPNTSLEDNKFVSLLDIDIVDDPQTPVLLQDSEFEGNLCNITKTDPIHISLNPGTIKHVHIGKKCSTEETEEYRGLFKEFRDTFSWSYEEIPGIESSIIVHEIKTYPIARLVRKKLRLVHSRKAAAIKAKVEKIMKVGFIYPIPLEKWVSNIILMIKKQGTIQVCIDF